MAPATRSASRWRRRCSPASPAPRSACSRRRSAAGSTRSSAALLDALISIPSLLFGLVVVAVFKSSMRCSSGCRHHLHARLLSHRPLARRQCQCHRLRHRGARARRGHAATSCSQEILPNIIGPILADFGLRFVFVILLLSRLSFLGLGVQPPHRRLGLARAREHLRLRLWRAGRARAGARDRLADHRASTSSSTVCGCAGRTPWRLTWKCTGAVVEVADLSLTGRDDAGREAASSMTSRSRSARARCWR